MRVTCVVRHPPPPIPYVLGRYVTDYQKFLEDLSTGSYVENSVDSVLLDVDGKRLMCEALYLLGVILLFMDLKVGHACCDTCAFVHTL